VRSEIEPFLLVAQTYRFRAHSMYDPDLYRPKEEVEKWKERDPITGFESLLLKEDKTNRRDIAKIEKDIDAEIAEAVAFAEAGELEPVEDLMKDVDTPMR
jgi:pyruvate dehydrogenase E1 component alpha subunit